MSPTPTPERRPALALTAAAALLGCAPLEEPLVLVLDDAGAATLVVFQWTDGGPIAATVADARTGAGLPTLREQRGELETVVLVYADAPESLGLAVGPLTPASANPSRGLPATTAYGVRTSGRDGRAVLERLAAPPERVASFRYAVACPTTPGREPIEVIAGCPPVFARPGPRCWGPPTPIASLEDPGDDDVGSVVREGDRTWLYLSTSRFGADSFSRHARVRMLDRVTPAMDTLEELPTLPPLTRGAAGWEVRGWAGQPWVRSDGLEMMFTASYPDQRWQDEDAYVATRDAADTPWSLGQNLTSVGSSLIPDDPVSSPVLLADHRTAVWVAPSGLVHGWRADARAGGREIVRLGPVVDPQERPIAPMHALSVGCGGGSLLYHRDGRPWMAEILEMPWGSRDGPQGRLVVRERELTELPMAFSINTLAEGPDCDALYLSDHFTIAVSTRVDCP